MKSRRTFLKTGIIAGGATLAGTGYYFTQKADNRSIAGQLVNYLDQHNAAKTLGASVVSNSPAGQFTSLKGATNQLLDAIGLSKQNFPRTSQNSVLSKLHDRVQTDFIEENIVTVDGWVLSGTEANLCALLHVLSAKYTTS